MGLFDKIKNIFSDKKVFPIKRRLKAWFLLELTNKFHVSDKDWFFTNL